jgi:tRNA pseudouridine55 synthase
MDGILLVDKPEGPTSHDIVDEIRRCLREKKVGHTGTLDPLATGVLPLVLGSATKLARYLSGGDKTYRAVIALGTTTTTLDAAGEIVAQKPVTCTVEDVRSALCKFVGEIRQVPPMYSAKKQQGKRLYELARKGVEVEREPKSVTIKHLDMLSCELPDITIDVACTSGTYVRVLAQDIGEALGCGGYLKSLRRTVAGPFSAEQAIPLADIIANPDNVRIIPSMQAFLGMARVDVPTYMAKRIATGYQLQVGDLKTLDVPEFLLHQAVLVGIEGGDLIAVTRAEMASADLLTLRRDTCALRTERVLGVA